MQYGAMDIAQCVAYLHDYIKVLHPKYYKKDYNIVDGQSILTQKEHF